MNERLTRPKGPGLQANCQINQLILKKKFGPKKVLIKKNWSKNFKSTKFLTKKKGSSKEKLRDVQQEREGAIF